MKHLYPTKDLAKQRLVTLANKTSNSKHYETLLIWYTKTLPRLKLTSLLATIVFATLTIFVDSAKGSIIGFFAVVSFLMWIHFSSLATYPGEY